MTYLTVVDEIFLRAHRGLGTPSVLQGLWRTTGRVEPALLEQVHATLRTGPLARRVVRSRVPGARPRWQANAAAHPLRYSDRPRSGHRLLEWADAQGDTLDPERGPGWRLAATRTGDGGTAISLTCSHTLADGRGLILAIEHALAGVPIAPAAPAHSEWRDAYRQWSIILGGTMRALGQGIPRRPRPASAARIATDPISAAVLRIPVANWESAAAARGGTANTLFLSVMVNMLWDSGFPGDTISACVPVDTRTERRVDNDMAMTEVTVGRADTPASLREKCRTAYEYRMTAPAGLPEQLLQVLPDRLAYTLSRGAGERDILCSNLGSLPTTLTRLGPHHCTGVAARAIHPGLRPDRLPRTRLSGYLCRNEHDYTLALVALDPARIGSADALTASATAALDRCDLPATAW